MVIKYFKAIIFEWRKKRAIKKAINDATLYRKKFLVIIFKGRPTVVSMQAIKALIRKKRFAKEFSPEKAEKLAIFIAYPPKN